MMNPMMQQFFNFMNQMKGQDPSKLLQDLLSSGRVSQSQLNQAQQMRDQLTSQFDSVKNTFGF